MPERVGYETTKGWCEHLLRERAVTVSRRPARPSKGCVVSQESAEYLLNVDEEEYLQHLVNRFQIEPLQIHFDEMYATTSEESIPANMFPGGGFEFAVERGQSYPKQVFRFQIPYSGTEDLLRCKPNPSIMNSHPVDLEGECICFDVVDFYSDAERVNREADRVIDIIRPQSEHVAKNITTFNDRLPDEIRQFVAERRALLRNRMDIAGALGVPIKKTENIPETFRIPEVRRKVVAKPTVPQGADKPEPVLGDDVYEEIVQVIHDTGKVFERLPNTYADKDEESLRDHLILQLEPRFEGSTTGETFNKTGKTDILIRHEKSNVFVAECQWWDGPKKHQEKIDQLLAYLTWRDSKTAIVCFVERKDFSNVLKQMVQATQDHPCHVRYIGTKDETLHNFEFHLPGDPGRRVKVAVLAFHLPRAAVSW